MSKQSEFRHKFYSRTTLQKDFSHRHPIQHICLQYVFVMARQKMHLHSILFLIEGSHLCSQSLNHGFPNSKNFGSQEQPVPSSRNKLFPNVSAWIPNLGTSGCPVPGTSGSQTFARMLPNLEPRVPSSRN